MVCVNRKGGTTPPKRFYWYFVIVIVILTFVALRADFFSEQMVVGKAVHEQYVNFSAPDMLALSSNHIHVRDDAIYYRGYYSINGSGWQPFTLEGDDYSQTSTRWKTGTVLYELPEEVQTEQGERYIIVYSCHKNTEEEAQEQEGAIWDCHGGWQLRDLTRPLSEVTVTTSFSYDSNEITLGLDGDMQTRWGAWGRNQWVQFSFPELVTFDSVAMAFYNGASRHYNLGIDVSQDGETWTEVIRMQSNALPDDVMDNFSFPEQTARYFRVIQEGYDDLGPWNSFYELQWSYQGEVFDLGAIVTCDDGVQSEQEEGIDCGGVCFMDCCENGYQDIELGETDIDCGNEACGICPTCDDGILNAPGGVQEEAIDCGGNCPDQTCCSNGIQDHSFGEEDIDCGGERCEPCGETCTDGIRNQDETGVDCGGVCGGDCCANGYYDANLGEEGYDCGPNCPDECHDGVTYYVANNGDDANDGLSVDTPWQTLAHVSDQDFGPGDNILFRRGDTWRESMNVHSSGDPENYITFGAYGQGDRPRFLGSIAPNWEPVDGHTNVWRATTLVNNPHDLYSSEIWFVQNDGSASWGNQQGYGTTTAVLGNLQEEFDTVWVGPDDGESDGTLYVYAPSDPDTRYVSVEIPVRRDIIRLYDVMGYEDLNGDGRDEAIIANAQYVAFEDLQLRYALATGITENYADTTLRGLRVTGCEIGYFGVKDGANMYGLSLRHSDSYIAYNDIHDCGRRSVSFVLYDYHAGVPDTPVLLENVLLEHNLFYNGYHTTGFDLSNQDNHVTRNITVRYNTFKGNKEAQLGGDGQETSNSIFIAHQGSPQGYTGDMTFHHNIFYYSDSSSIKLESTKDVRVYHNTFYKFNPTVYNYQAHVMLSGSGAQNADIKNNIFYHNIEEDCATCNDHVDNFFANNYAFSTVDMDYNLHYAQDSHADLVVYYQDGEDPHFYYAYQMANWNNYVTNEYLNQDRNSPSPADPQFVDPENEDFTLIEGSPAIDAGVYIPGFHCATKGLHPFDDCIEWMGEAPDLGKLEYGYADQPVECGNGICEEPDETCETCEVDCGACACVPDTSCGANTCVGETCLDTCGGVVDGTLQPDCGGRDCGLAPNGCGGDEACGSLSTTVACSIANGVGERTDTCDEVEGMYTVGVCTVTSCNSGYEPNNDNTACEAEVVCTSQDSLRCYTDGNVYWYDSCGNRETLYDDCTTGETCENGACVTTTPTSAIIADHFAAMDFENIPDCWLEEVRGMTVHYAHTSHGGQLVCGLNDVETLDSVTYEFARREATTEGLPSGNGLRMYDGNPPETYINPGDYYGTGADRTRAVADTGNYDVSLFSWCGEMSSAPESTVNTYLAAMSQFEAEYPDMRFILMTGHTDGGGATLIRNNNMIRDYALANNMVLFDFADMEKYYPNGTLYPGNPDDYCVWCNTWCANNPNECVGLSDGCGHTNANGGALTLEKGKAFWWMMARIAGWDGTADDTCP